MKKLATLVALGALIGGTAYIQKSQFPNENYISSKEEVSSVDFLAFYIVDDCKSKSTDVKTGNSDIDALGLFNDYCIKVSSELRSGHSGTIAQAITKAADERVDVINIFLNGWENLTSLDKAIRYAEAKETIVVILAGNDNNVHKNDFAPFVHERINTPDYYSLGSSTALFAYLKTVNPELSTGDIVHIMEETGKEVETDKGRLIGKVIDPYAAVQKALDLQQ